MELSAAESRYKDTPILDFINHVQTEAVTAALAGTAYAGLPVLSIAAPFSRTAVFPAGRRADPRRRGALRLRQHPEAVVITGAEVKAYLEYSAKYFVTLRAGRAGRPGHDQRPDGAGLQLRRRSPASTTTSTSPSRSASGSPAWSCPAPTPRSPPTAQFVIAVNNYRRSGGGNFPGIVKTQVYNQQQEIRQLLIDWAQAKGVIDPADFFVPNWKLVRDGVPVF